MLPSPARQENKKSPDLGRKTVLSLGLFVASQTAIAQTREESEASISFQRHTTCRLLNVGTATEYGTEY